MLLAAAVDSAVMAPTAPTVLRLGPPTRRALRQSAGTGWWTPSRQTDRGWSRYLLLQCSGPVRRRRLVGAPAFERQTAGAGPPGAGPPGAGPPGAGRRGGVRPVGGGPADAGEQVAHEGGRHQFEPRPHLVE